MMGQEEIMRFAGERELPIWLACTYLASNVVLNSLNFFWFGKMIEALRKRFTPADEKKPKTAANGLIVESVEGVELVVEEPIIVEPEKTDLRRRKA